MYRLLIFIYLDRRHVLTTLIDVKLMNKYGQLYAFKKSLLMDSIEIGEPMISNHRNIVIYIDIVVEQTLFVS